MCSMIILNEKKEAEKLLNDNNNLIKLGDLMLLAKYYDSMDMNVCSNLNSYICARTKEYNQVIYDDYIEKSFKHLEKFKLRESNLIPLTQKEHDAIMSISDFKAQRVMFVMLMTSKYYKLNPSNREAVKEHEGLYFKNSISDLFKLAKVTYSLKENIKITRLLSELGCVEWFVTGSAKILIADLNGIPIKEFVPDENIVLYLYQFHDVKIVECQECNRFSKVSKMANNVKYCPSCSILINKEKTKERVRKTRENKNV